MERTESQNLRKAGRLKKMLKTYGSSKLQQFYLVLTLVLCFTTVPLFKQSYEMQKTIYKQKIVEEGWPKFSDFYVSFIVFLVINRVKVGSIYLLNSFFMKRIRAKYQGPEREVRAHKAAKYVFKFGYFVLANLGGYLVLKDAYFTPGSMLGNGDPRLAMKDTLKPVKVPYLKIYYQITLGYHFESFMALIMNPPANDFGQMLFHHFLTVTLIGFSYYSNFLQIGSLVLFVHDWQDLWISLVRIIIDIKVPTVINLLIFLAIQMTWIWGRCIALPFDIIYRGCFISGDLYIEPEQKFVFRSLTYFLVLLTLLNYYWLYRFIQMAVNWKSKGTPQDLQNDPSKKQQ